MSRIAVSASRNSKRSGSCHLATLSARKARIEEARMATMTAVKRWALGWIDERAPHFSDFHVRIWNYAEPAWREYKSAKAYCELLRAEGFAVEEGSGEMPTAFCAR